VDERKLVSRILKGDAKAKDAWVELHHRKVYITVVHFLGAADPEVEDLVQETFAKALEGLGDFRFQASLATWMNHICVNTCYGRFRKRERTLLMQKEDLEMMAHDLSKVRHEQMAEEALTEARMALIRRHLEDTSEPCRTILRLRDVEGESYIKIGRRLKMPLGSVMGRLHRCRAAFRKAVLAASREKP